MIVNGERFSTRLERKYAVPISVTTSFFTGPFQKCLVGELDLKSELDKVNRDWWDGTPEQILDFWFDEKHNHIDDRFFVLFETLRKSGVLCLLATNNEKLRSDNLLYTRGLNDYFDRVFPSWFVRCKKPQKEFFDYIMGCLKGFGIAKEEVLFCDDDSENILGAISYGFNTHYYRDFHAFSKMLSEHLPR